MARAFWTDYVPSDRDILIDKVQRGELTPQKAEAEAARVGLEPFEVGPNPADFDPMGEASWSLPMALAWIMWRSRDPVREMWDLYREKFRFWVPQRWQVSDGPIYDGHFLETKAPAGIWDVAVLEGQHTHLKVEGIGHYLEAFRLLCNEGQRATWKASGVPTDGRARQQIEPFEWADFQVCEAKNAMGSRRAVLRDARRGVLEHGYNDVFIPAGDVRKSFPASGAGRRKGGRPAEIQYNVLHAEFLRLMDHHGNVSPHDPEWNSNEKVIEALQRFYSEKRKAEVSRICASAKGQRMASRVASSRSAMK